MGDKTMQLLKAMRGQLGDTSASRSVDAEAAANSVGMDSGTSDFERRLHDLVRAGYLEPDPNSSAPTVQRMYRITFSGIYAADNYQLWPFSYPHSPNLAEKLSEKGCQRRSERGFGGYRGAKTGPKVPLRLPVRLRSGCVRLFCLGRWPVPRA